jgi:hypothetical protein
MVKEPAETWATKSPARKIARACQRMPTKKILPASAAFGKDIGADEGP